MSCPTGSFFVDVMVLVATLQSAKLDQQSQLADESDNENQFSLGSIGTKEEDRGTQHRKPSNCSVEHIPKSFLNNHPTPSIELSYNHWKTFTTHILNSSDVEKLFIL